jgi:hypothetical protein
MAFPTVKYGPDSEVYNLYSVVSPAPGDNGSGGQIAQRGVESLGQQLVLADGRKFRFALGGALLVVGNTIQAADALTTSEDLTAVAAAIGSRIISFTHGGATTVVNFFAEGSAVISVTPGGGDYYKIASHLALTNGGTDIVNLAAGNAVRRALTTTSRVDLRQSPYANAIQIPSAVLTGIPLGVAVSAIASGGTGWLQTRGSTGVLTNGALIKGARAIVPGAAAAGACSPETPTTGESDVEVTLGTVLAVAATTAWSTVFLTLDG